MSGYRRHKAIRRILGDKRKIPKHLTQDVNLSAESLEKAREFYRENPSIAHTALPQKPETESIRRSKAEYFHYQQEVKLAKHLQRELPKPAPGRLLKLPLPKFSFLEEE
ncbi:MAG: hypothetical protein COB67_07505 [SAR324 cluster bacterium]|uniref:Uncharacterized protein n=1 Tax=SAR324 cluster bacterium TaxID=2024889 RepID=A0A2A4T365_9DELT|nr:MAG: hypothetical protein COB67_07505 [SAR324 cluster bacterium]